MNTSLFLVVAALVVAASSRSVFDSMPIITPGDVSVEGVDYLAARPTYDEKQFVGKKVFVTGGSSGIGFATALTFARFGADVVICSRDSNPSWFTGLCFA